MESLTAPAILLAAAHTGYPFRSYPKLPPLLVLLPLTLTLLVSSNFRVGGANVVEISSPRRTERAVLFAMKDFNLALGVYAPARSESALTRAAYTRRRRSRAMKDGEGRR